ncbi:MAG: tRNA lysidine(34) synthetase TilS [Phycisphaerales bacterium JB040]
MTAGGAEAPGGRDADRRTLVACSGGADSTALVLALASCRPAPIVGHVVHDLRTREESIADRDCVAALADALGLEFQCREIAVRDLPGNAEANARDGRYEALRSMADGAGVRYVATAHHADDQLETLLMRLIRGAGPEGLLGVRESRAMGACTLVRPMLGVTHSDAMELCARSGVTWREDRTNADTERVRAAIRHTVLPALEAVSPGASVRAGGASRLQRELVGLLEDRVRAALAEAVLSDTGGRVVLCRDRLAESPPIVVGGVLREVFGRAGRDGRTRGSLERLIGLVRDRDPGERSLDLAGVRVVVAGSEVRVSRAGR